MKEFIAFLLRKLFCQLGEVGLDIEPDADLEEEIEDEDVEDEDENIFITPDEEEEKPDGDEKKISPETEATIESLRNDIKTQSTEMDTLKSDFEKLTKDRNTLAYQLRTNKKEEKPTEEETFSDTQLMGLLEEHKDDPAATLQIIKLVASQAVKGNKKETLDAVEISQTKKELDLFISTTYPDFLDETGPIRERVNKMKSKLGIEDHPYGDWFGMASFVLTNIEQIEKQAFEKGQKTALGKSADDNRKKDIKTKGLAPAKKKAGESTVLSSRVSKVIKQMDMTPGQAKVYQKLMSKKTEGEG